MIRIITLDDLDLHPSGYVLHSLVVLASILVPTCSAVFSGCSGIHLVQNPHVPRFQSMGMLFNLHPLHCLC